MDRRVRIEHGWRNVYQEPQTWHDRNCTRPSLFRRRAHQRGHSAKGAKRRMPTRLFGEQRRHYCLTAAPTHQRQCHAHHEMLEVVLLWYVWVRSEIPTSRHKVRRAEDFESPRGACLLRFFQIHAVVRQCEAKTCRSHFDVCDSYWLSLRFCWWRQARCDQTKVPRCQPGWNGGFCTHRIKANQRFHPDNTA